MKTIQLLILFISFSVTVGLAQNHEKLYTKAWIRVKSERADGSKIIERGQRHDTFRRLEFAKPAKSSEKPSAYVSQILYDTMDEGQYEVSFTSNTLVLEYSLDSEYYKGTFSYTYHIDELTDSILVLTTIKPNGIYGNRDYYIPEHEYLDLLFAHKLVNLQEDTVLCNSFLFPVYKKEGLASVLSKKLSFISMNSGAEEGIVYGSLTVSPEGKISQTQITSMGGIDQKYKSRIIEAFATIENNWNLPPSPRPLFYKLDFKLLVWPRTQKKSIPVSIKMVDPANPHPYPYLSADEVLSAYEHYKKGKKLLLKKKFDLAIESFNQCLAIDSLCLEAYYDRAYANQMLKRMDQSCTDWKTLSDLGQMEGKKLYRSNCLAQ